MAFRDRLVNVTLVANSLPALAGLRKVVLTARATNNGIIYVGDANSQSVDLAAGDSTDIEVENQNEIYVRGTVTGDALALHSHLKGGY